MKKKTLLTGFFALMLVFALFQTGCDTPGDMLPKDQPENPGLEPSKPPEVEPSKPPEVEPSKPPEVEPSKPPEVEPPGAAPITNAKIFVIAPATGAAPSTTANGGDKFTVDSVSWYPAHNSFYCDMKYTVVLRLTANSGCTFSETSSATINGDNAAILNNTGTSVILSYTFPATISEEPIGIVRYKAEPNTGSTVKARNITGIDTDQIKYSFSYGGYDFYHIYLGVMANIPMFSFSTQEHSPSRPSDYTVTVTEEIRRSVSRSVSDSIDFARSIIDEYSRDNVTGHTLSYEIGATFPKIHGIEIGAKIGGEHYWEQYIGNSKTTGFEETTSLTRTEELVTENVQSSMQSRTFFLTSGMPAGYYRYTMFASSAVYLYVIRDSLTNELVHYELEEFVIPDDSFSWNLDFSETKRFGKRDASGFEFDITLLKNLPPAGTVTVSFDKNNPDGAEVNPQLIMVNKGGKAGTQMPEQPTRPEYTFVGWNTAANGAGTSFTRDSKVTGNITVYAQWLYTPIHRFTLTANPQPAAGGTVTPPSTSGIFPETQVKITAAPSAHYRFVNWTVVSGAAVFANADNQDTTVTLSSDAAIRANFEQILYTLSVDRNLTDGGAVNPTSKSDVAAETSVSISAAPANHYRFVRWEVVGGGEATIANSTSASTTVTLSSDATIRANFEKVQYRLTVERYAPNWVDRGGIEYHYALTSIAIRANDISGYRFINWTVVSGTAEFANANQSTTVTLKSDATIRANFLPTGSPFGGEVGRLSLYNIGAFVLRLHVQWVDNNGTQNVYKCGDTTEQKTRNIDPGADCGIPDGSWVRVFSSVAGGYDRQGAEYFLYRRGNSNTACYTHSGTTLIKNVLTFTGVK